MPNAVPAPSARTRRILALTLVLSPITIVVSFLCSLLVMAVVASLTPRPTDPQSGWDEMGGVFEGMRAAGATHLMILTLAVILFAVILLVLARPLRWNGDGLLAVALPVAVIAAAVAMAIGGVQALWPLFDPGFGDSPVAVPLPHWAAPAAICLSAICFLLLLRHRDGSPTRRRRLSILALLCLTGPLLSVLGTGPLDVFAVFVPSMLAGIGLLWSGADAETGGASEDAPPVSAAV